MQVFWKGLFELMICCLLQTVKAATFGIRRNLNKMTFSCVVEQKSFMFNSISLSKVVTTFRTDRGSALFWSFDKVSEAD